MADFINMSDHVYEPPVPFLGNVSGVLFAPRYGSDSYRVNVSGALDRNYIAEMLGADAAIPLASGHIDFIGMAASVASLQRHTGVNKFVGKPFVGKPGLILNEKGTSGCIGCAFDNLEPGTHLETCDYRKKFIPEDPMVQAIL